MLKTNVSMFYLFIISFLVSGVLVSCQPAKKSESNGIDCLPPLFEFSFPYKEPANEEERSPATSVANIIPQTDKKNQPITIYEGNLVVRNDDEIWLLEPLMRYIPSTKEIKEYIVWDNEGDMVYPGSLFLASDNTLYVEVNNSHRNGIAFARYDDKNDSFEIVSPATKMLLGRHVVPEGHTVFEDRDGNFWFVYENTLLFFNPKTQQTEKMLGEEQGYFPMNVLTKASNDVFFVLVETIEERGKDEITYSDTKIIQYNTRTGNTQYIGTPSVSARYLGKLFVDEKNRLWVSDYGYYKLDNSGSWKWYQVIQSPIFITDQMVGFQYQYQWTIAYPSLNTYNKYLWFTFSGGLARLDINKNEWCLVARMPVFDVAKDSHENLWFVSDKQLYKYEFQP